MSLININNLTFGYEESLTNVFENVSFNIDTDWKLGLIGRNGKGKTTFLKLLLGKYEYKGSISKNIEFDYFPFEVNNMDRIAIIGKNGVGKSSILKLILGDKIQYNGTLKLVNDLKISYVSQSTEKLKGTLKTFARENKVDESVFKAKLSKKGS